MTQALAQARKALETAIVAMKIASALPNVSDEYDFDPAIAECSAALAAIDAAQGGEWQPIKTAPKDGMRILAWGSDKQEDHCYVAIVHRFDGERGWWVRGTMPFYPKKWQPLPSPPTGA